MGPEMFSIGFLVLSILLSVYLGHIIARKKGLNPRFWGFMGAAFGPLMLPFILLAKPKNNKLDDAEK